jgi:hypothetical protein
MSPEHSSSVEFVLNLATGGISPQYHVVLIDDHFSTVPNVPTQGHLLDLSRFDANFLWTWFSIESGYKNFLEDSFLDCHPRPVIPFFPIWGTTGSPMRRSSTGIAVVGPNGGAPSPRFLPPFRLSHQPALVQIQREEDTECNHRIHLPFLIIGSV